MSDHPAISSRYSIISPIGRGGMGEVYKAIDNELKDEVALKIIHEDAGNNPRMRKCFTREAHAFNLLHHPNIVEIYDYGMTDSGQLYITMELIRGTSLHGLRDAQLPIHDVILILSQILNALSEAHARGLVHCDLKAENVLITMVNNEICAKLVDFGLASLPSDDSDSTLHSFGTPAYMSPEQILKQKRLIGPCSDIYASGILLYEALSGKLPFEGPTAAKTMHEQVNQSVPQIDWLPRFASLSDDLKAQLTRIVNTALRKNPWERYISAKAFKEDLLALQLPPVSITNDPILDNLREIAKLSNTTGKKRNTSDIGYKIRAIEAAEDSGIRYPPDKSDAQPEVIPHLSESLDLHENEDSVTPAISDSYLAEFVHQNELSILQKDAERTKLGYGRLRIISGSFGIGKTKLLKHFITTSLNEQFKLITCPASQYQDNTPGKLSPNEITGNVLLKLVMQLYGLFNEPSLSKHLAEISHSSDEIVQRRLMQCITDGTDISDQLTSSLIELISRLLVEASKYVSTVIIIDDFQRCTEALYRLLDKIKPVVERTSTLVLVTHDPHELSNCVYTTNRDELTQYQAIFDDCIQLKPLSVSTMNNMLKTCMHIEDKLSRRIAVSAFGNPYYASAIIQHLNLTSRLVRNKNNQLSLAPEDNDPIGVPASVCMFFQKKFADIAIQQGTLADFYREILIRMSAFGTDIKLNEAETYWRIDEDKALSSCWRDAIDSWLRFNLLVLHQSSDSDSTPVISFTEPWLVDVILSELSPRLLQTYKARAANTLIECYTSPDEYQLWKIAQLWSASADNVSFVQTCSQCAFCAFERANLKFAFDRCENLASVFDAMTGSEALTKQLVQAIDWPALLIKAAEICLHLDKFNAFDQYCEKLNIWQQHFNTPVLLAHIQKLNALKFMRKGQIPRAGEVAQLAHDSFLICNDSLNALRALIILADTNIMQNDIRAGKQMLSALLDELMQMPDCDNDIADVQTRLAKLEWFSGNPTTATKLIDDAVNKYSQNILASSNSELIQAVIHYMAIPDETHYAQVAQCYQIIAEQKDISALHNAQTAMLITSMLHMDSTTMHQLSTKDQAKTPSASLLMGTQSCIKAIELILSGDDFDADNEITMAIAAFGPQNRRARAWCHTLLGVHAIITRQLKTGLQAFERAHNDFQALSDTFGQNAVLVGQSALACACGQYDDATAIALDALQATSDFEYPQLSVLAYTVAASTCIHTNKFNDISHLDCHPVRLPPCIIFIWADKIISLIDQMMLSPVSEPFANHILYLIPELAQIMHNNQLSRYPSVEITL